MAAPLAAKTGHMQNIRVSHLCMDVRTDIPWSHEREIVRGTASYPNPIAWIASSAAPVGHRNFTGALLRSASSGEMYARSHARSARLPKASRRRSVPRAVWRRETAITCARTVYFCLPAMTITRLFWR